MFLPFFLVVIHPEDHLCLLPMCSALPIKEISVGWSWLQGKAVCWKQDMSNNTNTFCYKLSSSSTSLYNAYIILRIKCNTYFISVTIQPTCRQSLSAEHFAVFKGEKCTEERQQTKTTNLAHELFFGKGYISCCRTFLITFNAVSN